MSDYFWELGRDVVIVERQKAIAVYVNDAGDIVLRQEREDLEERDTYILVRPENAERVAHAILKAVGGRS